MMKANPFALQITLYLLTDSVHLTLSIPAHKDKIIGKAAISPQVQHQDIAGLLISRHIYHSACNLDCFQLYLLSSFQFIITS